MRMFRVKVGNEEGFGVNVEQAISACLYAISCAEKCEAWKTGRYIGALTGFNTHMTLNEFLDWVESMDMDFCISAKELAE